METVPFQLGSDPELMLRDIKTKELRSAIPIIKEGKGQGRALDDTGENCILHDNVLIEFNTKPAKTRAEFVATIGFILKNASDILAAEGLELHLLTSANFPKSELTCPEAKMFGCAPDYDAYGLTMNKPPAAAARLPFRSTGGHLHIGKHERGAKLRTLLDDPYGKVRVIKALDIIVGITSVFVDKDPTAVIRRRLYGKAGCHRPTEYGVEWRACGPWWLASPDHTNLVHRLTDCALSLAVDEKEFLSVVKELGGEDKIQDIINNSKTEKARMVFKNILHSRLNVTTRALIKHVDSHGYPCFYESWGI